MAQLQEQKMSGTLVRANRKASSQRDKHDQIQIILALPHPGAGFEHNSHAK
jgi:hypothetical protein